MQGAQHKPQIGAELLGFAASRVDAGQGQLAHYIKGRLSASGHPAAALLDYSGNSPFLNPSLFAFFSGTAAGSTTTLGQILYGSLPTAARPDFLQAYADRHGWVDLPGFGQLSGKVFRRRVQVAPARQRIESDGITQEAVFDKMRRIEGTQIEYLPRMSSLFKRIPQNGKRAVCSDGVGASRDCSEAISTALDALRRVDADLHRCLLQVTRQIVTYSEGGDESFAALAAHGAVFLRAAPDADEIFFIEDLTHQCGHLLFNAITLDRSELLSVDPDTPLARLTGEAGEARSIYVTLHGVFTACLMAGALFGTLDIGGRDGRQTRELSGRLSYIMRRLQLDLSAIREQRIFTDLGRWLMGAIENVFDEIYRSAKDALVGCDLSNQTYAFSLQRFDALNR